MKLGIIGAGAAGMTSAVFARGSGADVTLIEKNDRPGKKLLITGKGRCNVTNDSDVNTHIANIPTNPRFMYAALNRFTPQDTKDFFEELGVPLKTERGERVFPQSDNA
ncbi:MAG: NAD(P)/FAD-dependent oxidoreductase, partial [Candidatus Flemingiibacterium sp.]